MYSQDYSFEKPDLPKDGLKKTKKWYQRWWGATIIVVLAVFLSISVAIGFYAGKVIFLLRSGELTPEKIFGEEIIKRNLLALTTEDSPSFGIKDARVVIVLFADFQCPACYSAYTVVKRLRREYRDKIFFVFRDFPLIADHQNSLLAAMAANCANEQGKFWEMHDKIFENQLNITETTLKTYAIQLGLHSMEFGECISSGKYLEKIERDLEDGWLAGVRATPTFFINGIKVEGAAPMQVFEEFINFESSR